MPPPASSPPAFEVPNSVKEKDVIAALTQLWDLRQGDVVIGIGEDYRADNSRDD